MSAPTALGMARLKHLARYLVAVPEVALFFPLADTSSLRILDVYVDSDWEGCRKTRKSTSGGLISISGGNVKSWSKTHSPIALSSGEAEYYSLVKDAVEGLGVQSLARDLGWELDIILWVDSSAAKSMASRKGVGKVRHVHVRELWLQDAVRQQRLCLRKVPGVSNPADVLTKPKTLEDMCRLLDVVGVHLKARG